jgi:hypothetical protein
MENYRFNWKKNILLIFYTILAVLIIIFILDARSIYLFGKHNIEEAKPNVILFMFLISILRKAIVIGAYFLIYLLWYLINKSRFEKKVYNGKIISTYTSQILFIKIVNFKIEFMYEGDKKTILSKKMVLFSRNILENNKNLINHKVCFYKKVNKFKAYIKHIELDDNGYSYYD